MLRPTLLLVLCLGPSCGSNSTTTVLSAPIDLDEAMSLPLLEHPLPIVEVTLNGLARQRFLLDSGAEMSIIDLAQAQELGLEIRPYSEQSSTRGSGGMKVEFDSFVVADRLEMGELSIEGGRLPALESKVLSDLGILGVLGQDLMSRLVLVVDMASKTLHVLPPETKAGDIETYLGQVQVGIGTWGLMPFEARPCPFVDINIEGLEGEAPELEIDTGAVTSSFPGRAIEALGLQSTGTALSQGIGGVFAESTYDLKGFKLLDFYVHCEIKRSPLGHGLLGMDILGKFIFVLDGPGGDLWLFHRDIELEPDGSDG